MIPGGKEGRAVSEWEAKEIEKEAERLRRRGK
jgi:hypothetical protein